jgi:hypothetical protein
MCSKTYFPKISQSNIIHHAGGQNRLESEAGKKAKVGRWEGERVREATK